MAEGSGDVGRPNWGRPDANATAKIAKIKAQTLSAADAVYCVCTHTDGAHKVGNVRACAFCRCINFQPVEKTAVAEDAPKLSPAGQRALQILSQTAAFAKVPPEGLRALAQQAQKRLYLVDAELMTQGDESHNLHVIVKGAVSVHREVLGADPIILAELGQGEVVGEMGVLDGTPRSATVVALSDVETLELTATAMRETFREFPQALTAVLRMVNERLRTTDALVEKTLEIALTQFDEPEKSA